MRATAYLVLVFLCSLLLIPVASSQNVPRPSGTVTYRLEAVADTKLLMEGIHLPNYRGLEKILRGKADDPDSWIFVRGQALLIAESANLLLLRPPQNQGRELWLRRSVELRQRATELARLASTKKLIQSRDTLVQISKSCTQCHESFKVQVDLRLFAPEKTE